MTMSFLFLICSRRFVFNPWYCPPISEDPSMRTLCRGWSCGSSKDNITTNERINERVNKYRNNTLNSTLQHSLKRYVKTEFPPAVCLAGLFHLFGIGGYEENAELSLSLLQKGADIGFWACYEALAFHPFVKDRKAFMKKAASMGSVFAMLDVAFEHLSQSPPNFTAAVAILRHLGTASISSWYRKKRGGMQFAEATKSIYVGSEKEKEGAWKAMKELAKRGHLPAALWLADGLLTEKTSIASFPEVVNFLVPLIKNGPWKYDPVEIASSKEDFNKTTTLQYLKNMGNELASALLSYPILYK